MTLVILNFRVGYVDHWWRRWQRWLFLVYQCLPGFTQDWSLVTVSELPLFPLSTAGVVIWVGTAISSGVGVAEGVAGWLAVLSVLGVMVRFCLALTFGLRSGLPQSPQALDQRSFFFDSMTCRDFSH